MAEPLRNDDPLSSTRWLESPSGTAAPRPVSPRAAEPVALLPEETPSRPLGEWPEPEPPRDTRLESAGEAVGSAIGTVVNEARELPNRLQGGVQNLKRRFQVISGRAKSGELKQRASELTDQAQEKVSELTDQATREARHWEFRARLYAIRFPFQFIAGAAATGFVVGFLLRLWRDE